MITFRQKGDFSKLNNFLEKSKDLVSDGILNKCGREGVAALSSKTPVDTGLTAGSWYYKIQKSKGKISINFYNRHVVDGVPIAVILQYGHATNNGGWVEGIHYIDPAIRPIFDKIVKEAWRGVKNL